MNIESEINMEIVGYEKIVTFDYLNEDGKGKKKPIIVIKKKKTVVAYFASIIHRMLAFTGLHMPFLKL